MIYSTELVCHHFSDSIEVTQSAVNTELKSPAGRIRARLAAEGGRLGEGQTGRKAEGRSGTQQCNRWSSAEFTLCGSTALLGSPTTATFDFWSPRFLETPP